MTIPKAILTVVICLILGGVFGLAVGFIIGTFFPDALRVSFRMVREQNLDPVQVGVGLGIIQGTMLGALVGVAVVGLLAWFRRPLIPVEPFKD